MALRAVGLTPAIGRELQVDAAIEGTVRYRTGA